MRKARSLAEANQRLEAEDTVANAQRFDATMRRVLTVSKTELAKREAAYQADRPAVKRGRKKSA